MEQVVAQYGYPAVLVGTFLEGETILIVAGFAAHQGYLKLSLVILAAFGGSLMGDQLYFLIGRLKGRPFLQRRSAWQAKAAKVDHLIDRHGTWIMLGFRFLYGLRTITPFVIGASRVSPSRFLLLNAAGALVWAIAVGCLGFLFGAAAETVLRNVRKIEGWIVLAMLGAGAVIWVIYFLRKRKQVKREQAADRQQY
ncbi:MAG TPA: DedA family protein [Syntrophorhabdales bacterium]|nr:DedA family protein [Syntrophorhabdales bacterium]